MRFRPFHETIVDAIFQTEGNLGQMQLLADLIRETVIPKNHSSIIRAWDKVSKGKNFLGIPEDLREQRRRARQKISASAGPD